MGRGALGQSPSVMIFWWEVPKILGKGEFLLQNLLKMCVFMKRFLIMNSNNNEKRFLSLLHLVGICALNMRPRPMSRF